jgi:alcohol oxidase
LSNDLPHVGTWHKPGEAYDASKVHDEIKYTKEDDEAIDNWIAGKKLGDFA